jgi:hypothetical protein
MSIHNLSRKFNCGDPIIIDQRSVPEILPEACRLHLRNLSEQVHLLNTQILNMKHFVQPVLLPADDMPDTHVTKIDETCGAMGMEISRGSSEQALYERIQLRLHRIFNIYLSAVSCPGFTLPGWSCDAGEDNGEAKSVVKLD